MSVTLKTQKMLWGRAAGRCSFPECRIVLYEDATETDDPALIGEICHIVAESDGGPRSDPSMPLEQRDKYNNLVLLCRNHHRVIDEQEEAYTVDRLKDLKQEHEAWVLQQLDFDEKKQRDDEHYADIIDSWQRLAHLQDWTAWTSSILSHGQPMMDTDIDKDLYELRIWLLKRIWPRRYADLELAFQNFRVVLQDFHETFRSRTDRSRSSDILRTERFYKIDQWNPELYHQLLREYEFHVDLVQDLALELTRAANLVCDCIREHVLPAYRLKDGHLMIESGPNFDLSFTSFVVQYDENERQSSRPYAGLQEFLTLRSSRDTYFGSGEAP